MDSRPPWVDDLQVFACRRCAFGVEGSKKYPGGVLSFIGIGVTGVQDFGRNKMKIRCEICKWDRPKYEYVLEARTGKIVETIDQWLPTHLESMRPFVEGYELGRIPNFNIAPDGEALFIDHIALSSYNNDTSFRKKKRIRFRKEKRVR